MPDLLGVELGQEIAREVGEKCYGIHFSPHISIEDRDIIHDVLCDRRDKYSVIDQFAFGLCDPSSLPRDAIGTLVYVSKKWHEKTRYPHFNVELHYMYNQAWTDHVATCHVYLDWSESVEWRADEMFLRRYKQLGATHYQVWDKHTPFPSNIPLPPSGTLPTEEEDHEEEYEEDYEEEEEEEEEEPEPS